MSEQISAGKLFRRVIDAEKPLQIVGTINAYCAILAEKAGHRAIYLSGAGVANASFGLPDLGIISRSDVLEEVRRITGASPLPLLVDIDTGWGEEFGIDRTIKEMIRAGAAAVHLEDQVEPKRCGHRPNKSIVSTGRMVDRIKAAVDARSDGDLMIMARTDALATAGLDAAVERAALYVEAGAESIFAEGVTDLAMYRRFADAVDVPLLANMTEFGKTPYYTKEQFAAQGVAMVLYPLSAFRAMSRAALEVYETILRAGTQEPVVAAMQPREELYELLHYYDYERKLDRLSSRDGVESGEGREKR
ncbi:methylisocitrate lyase [Geobacter metallireducens RCH3]|uniref:2-methylisocitrate lyase n=1 Tax=Geobacter metallireducens (strain ATCC 53774 / DSM 7210 / GS-15) TaxID=269799 RepID=Q39WL4_GEOMG|nr:methylisocitrate lyase [Geobacter metallireducens]ABB31360.1 methylisocitrate lyase [Geobacter metallireducens GS-15]EHP86168.1 methylisocitrate lyase [Geobacter metallireducens RCH3]